MAQLIKGSLSRLGSLALVPSTLQSALREVEAGGPEIQGLLPIKREFKANLGYQEFPGGKTPGRGSACHLDNALFPATGPGAGSWTVSASAFKNDTSLPCSSRVLGLVTCLASFLIQPTLTGEDDDGDVANRVSLSQATVTDLHHEALEEVLESHHSQNGLHQRCQSTQLGPASQDKLTIGCICILEGYH